MEKNPAIDILTHTNDASYGVDFEPLAQAARHHGVALELNNSKTLMGHVDPAVTAELVVTCKKVGCRMVVNSDMHAIEELGKDDNVRPYLTEAQFPAELLMNGTARQAFEFVEERRGNKLLAPQI
jgi:histidinol phosphatase-like PHP family hydrolase